MGFVRREGRGRKRDQARETIIIAIIKYSSVALTVYQTLLYTFVRLIFTTAP